MATNIKARRLLSDLFKEGTEVRFGRDEDGRSIGRIGPFLNPKGKQIPLKQGEEVAMFIRPPDPVQRDMAIRAAQAKRAASLVRAKRDENSEEHLTVMAFLADMDDASLIDYVIIGDTMSRHDDAEREVLSRDQWKDMTQYQDAMTQFMDLSEEDLAENEEYQALMELDLEYGKQVREREEELREAQREALSYVPREVVEKKAMDKRVEIVGSQAFMAEYEQQMLYFSVRDADNIDKLFFENVHELASQPDVVQSIIQQALVPYIADTGEAKNSQGAVSGSDSSELPANPETSDSSTREEQIA